MRTSPRQIFSYARSSVRSSAHTRKPCASCTRSTTPRKAGPAHLATSAASSLRRMSRQPSLVIRLRCSSVVRLSYYFFASAVFCADVSVCAPVANRSSWASLGRRGEKRRHEAGRNWRDPQGAGIQRGSGVQVLDIDIDQDLFNPVAHKTTATSVENNAHISLYSTLVFGLALTLLVK